LGKRTQASNFAIARVFLGAIGLSPQKLCAGARPAIRQQSSAGAHKLLSVGHELTRIFGAGVHLLGHPLLTGRNGFRNRMNGNQVFRKFGPAFCLG
jgi:hypothetical protein